MPDILDPTGLLPPRLDIDDTVLSQYANSPALLTLIEAAGQWFDPSANLQDFHDLIWNVDTAVGYGLDVWGRIVGVGRVLQVASGTYLGFAEASDATSETPFNVAPLYAGAPTTSNYALEDESYRLLILAKAAANISDGSAAGINAILMALFPGRGNAYVTDGQNMTMTYTFAFTPPLTAVEFAIVAQSGVLPRPAGVTASVVQI
jgi:hypothetical protein